MNVRLEEFIMVICKVAREQPDVEPLEDLPIRFYAHIGKDEFYPHKSSHAGKYFIDYYMDFARECVSQEIHETFGNCYHG